jgi:transposase
MPNFIASNPEQATLLPLHVRDVLTPNHLVFLIHAMLEKQDLGEFVSAYGEEGQSPYHPAMMLEVLLYARCVGLHSVRKIEQRVKEDLGFRYLAGGCEPDYVSFNRFRLRHGKAIQSLFTRVTMQLLLAGVARIGKVVIDSTRIQSAAAAKNVVSKKQLQEERARLEREHGEWLAKLAAEDPQEDPGTVVGNLEEIRQRLSEIPAQFEQLESSGEKQLSRTDPDSRILHQGRGFVRGYTAEVVVSDEHFILAQQVTQNKTDNHSLLPLLDKVEQECGEKPEVALADSGFYCNTNVEELESRGIDGYVPDSNLAGELNGWGPARDREPIRHPGLQTYASEAAQSRRTSAVSQTQGRSGTGDRNPQRANGSAAFSHPWITKRERRTGTHGIGLQPQTLASDRHAPRLIINPRYPAVSNSRRQRRNAS